MISRALLFVAVVLTAWHIHALGLFGSRFEPNAETDRAVLTATLEDLATQPESERRRNKGARKVYVHRETTRVEFENVGPGLLAWPRNWQLSQARVERNDSEHQLDWPSTPGIEVLDLDEFRTWDVPEDSDFRCGAYLSRPGYSRDGRMALVSLSMVPSPHGTSVTYLLTFDGEKWTPLAWSFSFYA